MLVDNQFLDAKPRSTSQKHPSLRTSTLVCYNRFFLVSITSYTAQCNQSCDHSIGTASPLVLYTIGNDARINHSKTALAACRWEKKSCNSRQWTYITVRRHPCAYAPLYPQSDTHEVLQCTHPTQDYMGSGSSRQCTASSCGNVLRNTHVPFHAENEPEHVLVASRCNKGLQLRSSSANYTGST